MSETIGDYDPESELAEDYDYWIRVSKRFPMKHFRIPLYYYRRHPNSLYRSKYYDVLLVTSLVKLRHKIAGKNQIKSFLIDLAAKRGQSYKSNRIIARVMFSVRVSLVLSDLENGRENLSEAKTKLNVLFKTKIIKKII